MVCKENSKSNKTKVFSQSPQGKWTSFLDLELVQTNEKWSSLNTGDFTYYVKYNFAIKISLNALRFLLPTARPILLI